MKPGNLPTSFARTGLAVICADKTLILCGDRN